jgi:hypothetical protein
LSEGGRTTQKTKGVQGVNARRHHVEMVHATLQTSEHFQLMKHIEGQEGNNRQEARHRPCALLDLTQNKELEVWQSTKALQKSMLWTSSLRTIP